MIKKNITCIICPVGCEIEVEDKGKEELVLKNYQCQRGREYARKEFLHPVRILATTVKINDYIRPVIPVRTRKGIPKEKIFECMDILKKIEIEGPVKVGDVVVENILDSGTDVVVTDGQVKLN